ANEASNYSDLGRAFHAWDAGRYEFPATSAWLVFDAQRRAERGFVGDTVWSLHPGDAASSPDSADGSEPTPEWMKSATTLEELAVHIGVPPDGLRRTVDEYNEAAAAGIDAAFGRGSFIYDNFSQAGVGLRGLEHPPFSAVRVLPGALGTKGGLKTD